MLSKELRELYATGNGNVVPVTAQELRSLMEWLGGIVVEDEDIEPPDPSVCRHRQVPNYCNQCQREWVASH